MKQIFFILLVTAAIQAAGQVGAPLTVTRPGLRSETMKDGKIQTVRRIYHDHYDEIFIFRGKHTRADIYAQVYKDSTGMAMAMRVRDSMNRIKTYYHQPGGMEIHGDRGSVYWSWIEPGWITTARQQKVSQHPTMIWTFPDLVKVKKLKAERAKVDSTQRTILKNLKRKQ